MRVRTLTADTVPAFSLLCELQVERDKTIEILDRDGRMIENRYVDRHGCEHRDLKAHPLLVHRARLTKQVETLLARFCLAPFGKAIFAGAPKTKAEDERAKKRALFFGLRGPDD